MTLSEYLDLKLTSTLLTEQILRGNKVCVWRPKAMKEDGRTRYESFPLNVSIDGESDHILDGDFIQVGHSVLVSSDKCSLKAGLKFKLDTVRHSTVLL